MKKPKVSLMKKMKTSLMKRLMVPNAKLASLRVFEFMEDSMTDLQLDMHELHDPKSN